jgi:uncharacterized membrane protein
MILRLLAIFVIVFALVLIYEFHSAEKYWEETQRDSEEEK